MYRRFKLLLASLNILLLISATAFSQQTGGTIEGIIKDSQGAVIPNVNVLVKGTNVGFNRTVQSDENGVFKVQQVPPGDYNLTVLATAGFGEKSINVSVAIEKITTTTIELTVGKQTVNVDVISDPTGISVDSTDSKIQTSITSKLIDTLPKGVNFSSILKISPATRPEPLSGQFQVDGASGSENSFVIDGQDVTNFRTGTLNLTNSIPSSLVQEVQIKTSGFEAEHGGASGGVIVVSTKGGSDRWAGEFGTQFDISKFQAQGTSATGVFQSSATTQKLFSIQQPKDGGVNSYPNATIGGAIVKRRLWALGSYSPQIFSRTRDVRYYNSDPTNLVINPNFSNVDRYEDKNTFNYAFGRLDSSPTDNIRLFASFLWNPTVTDGFFPLVPISVGGTPSSQVIGGTTFSGPSLAALQGGRINANTFTSQATWTPTGKSVLSVRYGRGFLNQRGVGSYAVPNETRFQCAGLSSSVAYTNGSAGCARLFQNNLNNSTLLRDVSIRNTFNADFSYFLNFGGSHNFKGGYEYGTIKNDVSQGFKSTGIVTLQYGRDFDFYGVGGSCATIANCIGVGRMTRFGTQGVASNKYQGIYFQDKWQPIKNLSLNLGIRAEKEDLPAFNTDGTGGQPISFGWGKKIAPRLGVSYDPFGDGKTRIFGSFGLFYDRLKFDLPRGSFGGDFFRRDYFPILSTNPRFDYYTPSRIVGSFTDPIGGGNPSLRGGLSILQQDFRIPSNITPAQFTALGLPIGGVDPDLKPFTQSEITFGFERELSKLFVLSARFTRKNVEEAIEDQANLGAFEAESYIIGNPAKGFAFKQRQAAGYAKQTESQRLYRGLEIVLNKRLSDNYFFSANYTYSRLKGNYSGLASSDEIVNGVGRTSPGVNRFFDYVNNGFNALGEPDNGLLATDRPHSFKAYGGYSFDWFKNTTHATDFSFFTTVQSGTPQTTFIGIVQTTVVLSKRGDLGRSPRFSSSDFSISHKYKFGTDNRFKLAFDVNFINVFNQNGVIALNATKYLNVNGLSGSDIDPCYDPDGIRPAGCVAPLPVNTLLTQALNNVLNGRIGSLLTDLDNLPGNLNSRYKKPSAFQTPRSVRFGFRFIF